MQELSSDFVGISKQLIETMRLGLNTFSTRTSEAVQSATKILRGYSESTSNSNMNSPVPTSTDQLELIDICKEEGRVKTQLELLNPRGRVDYILQEGVLENPYISAIGVQ